MSNRDLAGTVRRGERRARAPHQGILAGGGPAARPGTTGRGGRPVACHGYETDPPRPGVARPVRTRRVPRTTRSCGTSDLPRTLIGIAVGAALGPRRSPADLDPQPARRSRPTRRERGRLPAVVTAISVPRHHLVRRIPVVRPRRSGPCGHRREHPRGGRLATPVRLALAGTAVNAALFGYVNGLQQWEPQHPRRHAVLVRRHPRGPRRPPAARRAAAARGPAPCSPSRWPPPARRARPWGGPRPGPGHPSPPDRGAVPSSPSRCCAAPRPPCAGRSASSA